MDNGYGARKNGIRILFLGQCLNYGYEGVERSDTFPAVAASMLKARFSGINLEFDYKYLHHPLGLRALLRHRLLATRTDIAVISVPAMFAATHRRVSLIYELAPEIVDTARSFLQRLEGNHETIIDRMLARHPPLALDEYETLIEGGVRYCRQASRCRPVLMGPGRFNDDTIENYAVHSPELWSSVNQMVNELGNRLKVPVINAQEALEEHGGEIFITNNHRWSKRGHEVVAREVESVLAAEVAGISAEYLTNAALQSVCGDKPV